MTRLVLTARRHEPPEDSVALRAAVAVAVIAAAIAVLREGVGGALLWCGVLLGLPGAFVVAHVTRARRPAWIRMTVLVLAAFAAVAFVQSLAGTATSVSSAQVPLAELFVWLQLLHALDSPGRHGLMVSLLSSLVLVTIAAVFSISMAIVPWLLLWSAAASSALVIAHRSAIARLPRLAAPSADTTTSVRDRRVPDWRALGSVVTVFVAVLALAAAAFMVVPVAGTARALTFPAELPNRGPVPVAGGLSNPSLGSGDPASGGSGAPGSGRASFGYFGFSRTLDTGVRGRPDDSLVMRVRASSPDFWRGQTFDVWNGREWSMSDERSRAIGGEDPIRVPDPPDDPDVIDRVGHDELVQTFYVERTGPNLVFGAPQVDRVYFPDRALFQLPDGALRAAVRLDAGSVYTVVSRRPLVTEAALRGASTDPEAVPEAIRAKYAATPVVTGRVAALARSVTRTSATTYDKVRAIEAWMATHTKYSLDIPPLPRRADAVDRFLFVDRRGFCEQIGTALVVMLRSLGIPARLAVGYTSGERNPFTGLYEVHADDAHAWAEVYFPGVGWQGFDPTASVPLAGDSSVGAAGTGSLAYLTQRISVPAWAAWVLAAFAAAALAVVAVRTLIRRRRRPRASARPRTWAARALTRLERAGRKRGRARDPAETAREYAAALAIADDDRAPVDAVAVIDTAMFSGHEPSAEERARADALIDALATRKR